MGRANRPVRTVKPGQVKAGDVVLVRYPSVPNSRWMLVDYVVGFGRPHVWSGRWAFGKDAGTWVIQVEHTDTARYTVKDARDAARDRQRLEALRATK
jgi:hypothetical protein